jgi:hypothetical protein
MAVNLLDPVQEKTFREQALALGAPSDVIESVISKKKLQQQQASILSTSGEYVDPAKATVISEAQRMNPEYKYVTPKEPAQIEAEQKAEAGQQFKNLALSTVKELRGMEPEELAGPSRFNLLRRQPIIPTSYADKKAKYDQVKSMLSLDNRQMLKGTGTISDFEAKMLESAATALRPNMTDEGFNAELQKIEDVLSGKYKDPNFVSALPEKPPSLGERIETQLYDEEKRNPVLNYLMGPVLNAGKDIKITSTLKGKQGDDLFQSFTDTVNAANALLEKAELEQDPIIKARMIKVAESALKEISSQQDNIMGLYSKDVNKSYEQRGVETGEALVNTAAAVLGVKELVQSGLGKAQEAISKKGVEKVSTISGRPTTRPSLVERVDKLNPIKVLSGRQAAGATSSKIPVNQKAILDAGQNIANKSAADAQALKNLKPSIAETKDATKLLENLRYWGEQTFTQSGAVKDKAQARVASALYRAGVEQLKVIAPEAYKYRRILAYTFQLPKTISRGLWRLFLVKAGLGFIG